MDTKILKQEAEKATFDEIVKRLNKIFKIMNDPYKSPECQYSLIEDVMNGKY